MELVPNLGISSAAKLHEDISALQGRALTLNAVAVKHLDAPCAQILIAAKLEWASAGHPFDIKNPSTAFNAGLEALDLTTYFIQTPEIRL
jgi:anti-anti-sigma regulatory factor